MHKNWHQTAGGCRPLPCLQMQQDLKFSAELFAVPCSQTNGFSSVIAAGVSCVCHLKHLFFISGILPLIFSLSCFLSCCTLLCLLQYFLHYTHFPLWHLCFDHLSYSELLFSPKPQSDVMNFRNDLN